MALHDDLLEQAEHLARREPKRPRQASLRRAVSAAYYALFHLLIAEGAQQISPSKPAGLRQLIQRAFNHGEMRNVCRGFADGHKAMIAGRAPGQIPAATRRLLKLPLDDALLEVMEAFVDLQDARNNADYNIDTKWSRLAALEHVGTARRAFRSWMLVRGTPNATVFVVALLIQKHWADRTLDMLVEAPGNSGLPPHAALA